MRYLTRLKSSKENPMFQIFRNCDSTKFTGARSSKPLQIRINEEVQDVNVKQQKILEVAHQTFPPWKTPEPSICSNPLPAGKSSLSAEEARSCFLEHSKTHKHSVKLYTDGSKSLEGVGCAVVHECDSYVTRLSNNASIFTAELTAVMKSLEVISTIKGRNFTVFTDC